MRIKLSLAVTVVTMTLTGCGGAGATAVSNIVDQVVSTNSNSNTQNSSTNNTNSNSSTNKSNSNSSTNNSSSSNTASTQGTSPQAAVNRHNAIRAEVFKGAKMSWDSSLARSAQAYANKLASTGKFEHDRNNIYGENLYASTSARAGYLNAINSWYSEKRYYHYGDKYSSKTGHYTQMIWKKSTHLGCGKAIYKKGPYKGGAVIVCRYNPPGNYVGENPY